ncbi:ABC transporter permease [Actinoallomurus soli]
MLAKLTYLELKLLAREVIVPAVVLLLPLALLLGFGFQPGANKAQHNLGGQTAPEYMAALGVGIAVTILGLSILPTTLAGYREKGVLRRMATTPVRPAYLLMVQLLIYVAMAIAAVAMLIVAARILFGTPVPERFPAFLAAFVLGMGALFGIGLVIAAVAPSSKAGTGIGMLLFFPSTGAVGMLFTVLEMRRREILDRLAEANASLEVALEENAGLHAQLLVQAREAGVLDERQRMAREIHDTLAQGFTRRPADGPGARPLPRRAQQAGARGARPRRRRHHQPGGGAAAVRQRGDHQDAPAAHLRQARRPGPCRRRRQGVRTGSPPLTGLRRPWSQCAPAPVSDRTDSSA